MILEWPSTKTVQIYWSIKNMAASGQGQFYLRIYREN